MNWKTIYYTVLFSLFLACSKDDAPDEPLVIHDPIEDGMFGRLENDNPPVAIFGTEFYSDVVYGDHERETFDLFYTPNAKGTIITIHGGSFIRNSKEITYESPYNLLLTQLSGYNIVNVNYQLLDTLGNETEGVIKSLRSIEKAVDFVEENFEGDIILAGVSAGAGFSLWYGLDDSKNDRISKIVALEAAGTYNLPEWETYIPGLSIEDMLLSNPEGAALYRAFTANSTLDYGLVDYDDYASDNDPIVFLSNTGSTEDELLHLLHHPAHQEYLTTKLTNYIEGSLFGVVEFIKTDM